MLNPTAAQVWRVRERTEDEARDLFARLERDLKGIDAPRSLIDLARQAAQDEGEHAALCRRIVDAFEPGLPPLPRRRSFVLGPADLDPRRRVLYQAVALSCVTESLSVGLLLHIREGATDPVVAPTVNRILKDEVGHGQIGWGLLALEARRGDTAWLSPHLPEMLGAAVEMDEDAPSASGADLRPQGILSPDRVQEAVRATLTEVIFPGFERFGVDTSRARVRARESEIDSRILLDP